MNHRAAGFAVWTIAIVLVSTFASVPASAISGPCAGASLLPPVVYADPECLNSGDLSTTNGNWEVHPVMQGENVQITWAFNGTTEDLDEYVIYRGATPDTLYPIATVSEEANAYTDNRNTWDHLYAWYAVGALYHNGTEDRSPSHLIQIAE